MTYPFTISLIQQLSILLFQLKKTHMFSQLLLVLTFFQITVVGSSLCLWQQFADDANPLLYYFRSLKTGKCSQNGQIKNKQNKTASKTSEITILIQDLGISSFSLVMLECFFEETSETKSSCLIYTYKRGQIRMKLGQQSARILVTEGQGQIEIKIYKMPIEIKLGPMETQPSYLDISIKIYATYPLQSFYTLKLLIKFFISPFIFCAMLFSLQNSPFIQPFESLVWTIILSLQSNLLRLIIQSFKHFANFDTPISLFFLVSIFISNFALFGYSCHLLFQNIYEGSLEMRNMQQNLALDQHPIQSQSLQLNEKNGLWAKLTHLYSQKTSTQKRVIRFLAVFIFYFCLPSQYPQISLILLIGLLILPSAYFHLLSINSSTQFIVGGQEVRENKQGRDDFLLPVNKIQFLFLLQILRFFSQLQIQQRYKSRTLAQLGIIILINLLTLYLMWAISRQKKSKKIKILLIHTSQNIHLQEIQSCFSKPTNPSLSKEQFQYQCSICLQKLNRNYKSAQTQCGHLFHFTCLSKWMHYKAICPVDRNRLCMRDLEAIENQREDKQIQERVSMEI